MESPESGRKPSLLSSLLSDGGRSRREFNHRQHASAAELAGAQGSAVRPGALIGGRPSLALFVQFSIPFIATALSSTPCGMF